MKNTSDAPEIVPAYYITGGGVALGSILMPNGSAIETTTGGSDAFSLSGYTGAAYVPLLTVTNAATPTIAFPLGFTSAAISSLNTSVDQEAAPLLTSTATAPILQDGSANTGTAEPYDVAYEAMKFTASGNLSMRSVNFRAKWVTGAPTNPTATITAYLYADDGGSPSKPTGAALASGLSVRYGSLTSGFATYQSLISYACVSGTSYWIVLKQSSAPTGGTISLDTSNAAATAWASSPDGSTWTAESNKTGWFQIVGRSGYGVYGFSTNNYGIYGSSTNNSGVSGSSTNSYGIQGSSTNNSGVSGSSTNSYGIQGSSPNSVGVYGISTNNIGIQGSSTNSYGVYGSSTNGVGVSGSSTNSYGVYGSSTNDRAAYFQNANGGSTSHAGLTLVSTWNTTGAPTGLKVAITDTASDAASLPFQILGGAAGATNLLSVSKTGALSVGAGPLNIGPTTGNSASGSTSIVHTNTVIDMSTATGTGTATVTSAATAVPVGLTLGVSARVTTILAGASLSTWSIGVSGATTRFGTGLAKAQDTLVTPATYLASTGPFYQQTTAGLVITAAAGVLSTGILKCTVTTMVFTPIGS